MDIKTIKHIASLARIELTAKEEEKFRNELSLILEYVEHLAKADTKGVEPLYQTTGLVNSLRKDEDRTAYVHGDAKLIGQAPEKEERFIKVRSVINK